MEDRFDTLNENQKSEVMNFLQITGTEDINSAISYMEMSNYDVGNAVNLFFQNQEGGGQSFGQPQRPNQLGARQTSQNQGGRSQRAQNPLDGIVKEYKKHLEQKSQQDDGVIKKTFKATMSGAKNVWNSIMPIAIRGETAGGEEFRLALKRQYPNLETYNFQNGTFEEVKMQNIRF